MSRAETEIWLFDEKTAYALSNDSTAPSFDGQSHTPDDYCSFNDASHLKFAQSISDRQANYLRSLPPSRRAVVLNTVGATRAQRVKKILLNYKLHQPGTFLSMSDLIVASDNCYNDICAGIIDVDYILDLMDAIIDRTEKDALTKGKGVQGGAEMLLSIASRMIKGQACGDCGAGVWSQGCTTPAEFVVDGLLELEEVGKKMNLEWKLTNKAKFSLDKLCSVYGHCFDEVKHLSKTSEPQRHQELEEMWCNDHPGCNCWDDEAGDNHYIGCEIIEL